MLRIPKALFPLQLALILVFCQCSSGPKSPNATGDDLLALLPRQVHDQGRAILTERDGDQRADLIEALIEERGVVALDFLIALLEKDPSPKVRAAIVDQLGEDLEGDPAPKFEKALSQAATGDPDVGVALRALEELRSRRNQTVMALLRQRLQKARSGDDANELRRLALEEQRWVSLSRGTMLPGFLQVPVRFSVKPFHQPVRVLAFGDYGDGSAAQKKAASAMLSYHRSSPFDFAITLGDNFYSKGMESPADPRWKTWWEEPYTPLGIPFYASLGNHDWGFADSPAAEIIYTAKSRSWKMPAAYYTFTAGPVQFFALDTMGLSEAQLLWVREELERSRSLWKVVYAHHPIYSHGRHEDNPTLIARLLPVLRDRADVYLAGHDHDMQHLKPEGRLHFFVAGSGGKLRPIEPGPRSLFAKSSLGFAVLEAGGDALKIQFIDAELTPLYEYRLRKYIDPSPGGQLP